MEVMYIREKRRVEVPEKAPVNVWAEIKQKALGLALIAVGVIGSIVVEDLTVGVFLVPLGIGAMLSRAEAEEEW